MHGSTKRLPSLTATVVCFIAWKASAQSPGYSMAFTTVDERTFYFQGGGGTPLNTSESFYSLDLTHSWETVSPPWTPVHIVGPYPERLAALGNTMVYSRSLQTLTTLDLIRSSAFITHFDLATGTYEDLSGLPPTQVSLNATDGVAGAVDPTTNHVYIPGAYAGGTLMLDFDLVSRTATTLLLPAVASKTSGWSGYTFVWNEVRRSFFLWGGRGHSESSYFFEFKPGNVMPWTELV
ncbi:hypothetical protein BG015_000843 [Linnemannia schmuckeri]|uniref:Uncharacterized protein n=1 Tax=Linnemannia schmuckeri TaxID=64567 RepID=A0A9P5RTA1_9FUNG|nr:hypothetical protein BG015_000843 [Linnemannia schmuckeri]